MKKRAPFDGASIFAKATPDKQDKLLAHAPFDQASSYAQVATKDKQDKLLAHARILRDTHYVGSSGRAPRLMQDQDLTEDVRFKRVFFDYLTSIF